VAVDVHRRAHLVVAEELHDHARVDVLAQQQSRGRVPPVVEADVADAGLSRCRALGVGAGRLNCAVAGIVEGR
jgi:hypothetical protein